MKYKIGDKVRIRPDLTTRRYKMNNSSASDAVISDMLKYADKIATITTTAGGKYRIDIDGRKYNWTDEMFEEPKHKPIIIYQKDNQVIALDKNTDEKATAVCCSEDHFDFYVGANLAYDRLKEKLKEKAQAFNLGDYITGTDDNDYLITCAGWIGKVVKLEDEYGDIEVQRLNGGTTFPVNPRYFRLATDEDLTVERLKMSEK
jgi:hypothetical protein